MAGVGSETGVSDCEIVCRSDPFAEILPTGALLLLIRFAERIGFLDVLREYFSVEIKTIDYTPWDKLHTLICSLAVGCTSTKDVNHKLRPYPLAARFLGMSRFPEQSTLNRFLHGLGPDERRQLEFILELLLQRFGLWRECARVPLDIDSTGLMVYGRTYEFARKGYFPRQRGRRGYRLSVASSYSEAGSEILVPVSRSGQCLPGRTSLGLSLRRRRGDRVHRAHRPRACGRGLRKRC